MAVEVKVAPDEKLENVSVFLEDRRAYSQYFNLTEFPDTFTGGKNAFLIAGTDYLEPNTEILVQIRDANGKVVYTESSDGNPEYYEGVSKVIAVYVYPSDSVTQAIDATAYGPCEVTILGQLKYYDNAGIKTEVPEIWKGKYNVRYVANALINPRLSNTTKVRFFRRPTATITEILKPVYVTTGTSVSASYVTQSYANIQLSRLETFAGDVKRVKVYRSSESTISDYELIQDIQIEAKELLSTFDATGSVVTDTGFFNVEILNNFWDSGSLSATLDTNIFSGSVGVKLNGSGNFSYVPQINLSDITVYELTFDAFYSGSTDNSSLSFYVSGSQNGLVKVGSVTGITPTKNLTNSSIQFTLDKAEPSASFYINEVNGLWFVKDISLRASQETVFSPNEVSFITSMPTNISNETYNFRFEFFDVNNNYVPVYVTGSQTFTGGNTNTATIINNVTNLSSSLSGSIAELSASVSTSFSSSYGTIGTLSSSVSTSIADVSSSLSGSISNSLSESYHYTDQVSASLSSSISTYVWDTISASFASGNVLIYSSSQYLEKYIFNDEYGKINRPPTASAAGLYMGDTHFGYYKDSQWKTYMDNQGDFYLTSSIAGGGFIAWSSLLGSLQVQGEINIQDGGITNAATKNYVTSSVNTATASLSASLSSSIGSSSLFVSSTLAPNIFTDSTGQIKRPPVVLVNSAAGLYLGSTNLGYYSGSAWKTYMANNGNFYLSGAGTDSLSWVDGVLTINGAINVTGGTATTKAYVDGNITTISGSAWGAYTSASAYSASISSSIYTTSAGFDGRIFTDSTGKINKTPNQGSTSGLYLGSTYLGYYNGTNWKTYMSNTGNFYLGGTGGALQWDGTTLSIAGNITVTGGNAATSASAYTMATTSANTAYTNASASAYTQANTAYTNAKSIADSIANGSYSTGTFISSTSVISPILAGANGYISNIFKVGSNGITLDGAQSRIFVGTGNYSHVNTPFYFASGSTNVFSLADKLTWDGTTLTVNGNIQVNGAAAITSASAYTLATNSANTAQSTAISTSSGSAYTMATTSANTAQSNAISSASGSSYTMATTSANTAYNNASASAYTMATTSANTVDAKVTTVDAKVFTDSTGRITKAPTNGTSGLFLGNTAMGFHNGSTWKTYMSDTGNFFLSGTADNSLSWNGTTLSINGAITSTIGAIGGWLMSATSLQSGTGRIILDSSNNSISLKDSSNTTRVSITTSTDFNSRTATGSGSGTSTSTQALSGASNGASTTNAITTATLTANQTYEFIVTENTPGTTAITTTVTAYASNNYEYYVTNGSQTYSILLNSATIYGGTSANFQSSSNTKSVVFTPTSSGNWTLYKKSTLSTSAGTGNTWYPTVNWSWQAISSFVEVISGGIQVARSSTEYVVMSRAATAGSVMLSVGGAITATGNITAYYSSDRRLKENIITIGDSLSKLNKIRGVSFDWTDEFIQRESGGNGEDGYHYRKNDVGVIAQEIQSVLPEVVAERPDGYLAVKYEKIVPLLIEAIKELSNKVEELETKLNNI